MTDLDAVEREFIGDRGNGTLHPSIGDVSTFQPHGFQGSSWTHIGWGFLPEDLEALTKALGGVRWEDLSPDQQGNPDAWPKIYADSVPEFPLLGRICDIYRDAVFHTEEIAHLDAECARVHAATSDERERQAMNKLRLLCRKASERATGLVLLCD